MTFSPTWNSTVTSLSLDGLRGGSCGEERLEMTSILTSYDTHGNRSRGAAVAKCGERVDAELDLALVVVEVRRDAQALGLLRHQHASLAQERRRARRLVHAHERLAGTMLAAGRQHLERRAREAR